MTVLQQDVSSLRSKSYYAIKLIRSFTQGAILMIILYLFFSFLNENTCYGPSLKRSRQDGSNKGHNVCLYANIWKIIHTIFIIPVIERDIVDSYIRFRS